MDIYQAHGITPDFRHLLGGNVGSDPPPPYRELYSLGTSLVTTNYDEWLDALAEAPAPPDPLGLSPIVKFHSRF